MSPTEITVSVRNDAGAWEVIIREKWPTDGPPATNSGLRGEVEVSAHDIGGPVGQLVLVELRDDDDTVIEGVEVVTS